MTVKSPMMGAEDPNFLLQKEQLEWWKKHFTEKIYSGR